MCFVNEDYDWIARVVEEADITVAKPCKCSECGGVIPIGDFAHTIHQQEHEQCHDCEYGDCECSRDDEGERICETKGCQCEKPNLGESFDYIRCEGCEKFLYAVQVVEEEEGCHHAEARPALPMWDDLQGIGRSKCKKYWKKAAKMFPEIKASGHLGLLWRMAF